MQTEKKSNRIAVLIPCYNEAETLEIVLKDHASGLRAHLLYGVFPQLDVITRAVRLENTGTAPVTVKKAMSMEMDSGKRRHF